MHCFFSYKYLSMLKTTFNVCIIPLYFLLRDISFPLLIPSLFYTIITQYIDVCLFFFFPKLIIFLQQILRMKLLGWLTLTLIWSPVSIYIPVFTYLYHNKPLHNVLFLHV